MAASLVAPGSLRLIIVAAVLAVLVVVVVVGVLVLVPAINLGSPAPVVLPSLPAPNVTVPVGSALALDLASESAAPSHTWYNFSVAAVAGGLALDNLEFQVQSPTGSIVVPSESWSLDVLNVQGVVVGVYSMPLAVWEAGGAVPLTSQDGISLDAAGASLSGDTFIAIGAGSFQGSVDVPIR